VVFLRYSTILLALLVSYTLGESLCLLSAKENLVHEWPETPNASTKAPIISQNPDGMRAHHGGLDPTRASGQIGRTGILRGSRSWFQITWGK
jgi:hypothetical protein